MKTLKKPNSYENYQNGINDVENPLFFLGNIYFMNNFYIVYLNSLLLKWSKGWFSRWTADSQTSLRPVQADGPIVDHPRLPSSPTPSHPFESSDAWATNPRIAISMETIRGAIVCQKTKIWGER